jgi:hypothetical protein
MLPDVKYIGDAIRPFFNKLQEQRPSQPQNTKILITESLKKCRLLPIHMSLQSLLRIARIKYPYPYFF